MKSQLKNLAAVGGVVAGIVLLTAGVATASASLREQPAPASVEQPAVVEPLNPVILEEPAPEPPPVVEEPVAPPVVEEPVVTPPPAVEPPAPPAAAVIPDPTAPQAVPDSAPPAAPTQEETPPIGAGDPPGNSSPAPGN